MEFYYYSQLLLATCLIVWRWFHLQSRHKHLPPGPYPVPIIGNILQFGKNPHISLANLSKNYGPLMYLKLGTLHTIVISTPEMAKELLQKHDLAISCRTTPLAAHAYNYYKYSMPFLTPGDQWRTLRRICKEHIFSTPRMDTSEGLRQGNLLQLRQYLHTCSNRCRAIDIGEVAFATTLGIFSGTLFSCDFGRFDSEMCQKLRRMVRGTVDVIGTPNVADFFPVFKVVDPQRIMSKAKASYGKLLDFLQDVINQRVASRSASVEKNDLLQVLLHLSTQGNDLELRCDRIKYLLLDLFVAGTDTTSTTVEWAMTELLRNPEIMSKLRDELRALTGQHGHIKESDISKLPYLRAVVKETLRCHPALPLIPRKAEANVETSGYMIPKNALIMINMWAIGRDPRFWSNPNSFEPERFLESKLDYKGQDFEFIPFGSGRRICPGLPLAHRMVHLIIASLVYDFDWKLEGEMRPDEIDLKERFGATLVKDVPVKATPIKL